MLLSLARLHTTISTSTTFQDVIFSAHYIPWQLCSVSDIFYPVKFFALTVIHPILHNQVPSIHPSIWSTLCKAFGATQVVSLAIGHNPGQVIPLTQIRYLWSTVQPSPKNTLFSSLLQHLWTFRIAHKPPPHNLLKVPLNTCPRHATWALHSCNLVSGTPLPLTASAHKGVKMFLLQSSPDVNQISKLSTYCTNNAYGKHWNCASVQTSDTHLLNNFTIISAQKYNPSSLIFQLTNYGTTWKLQLHFLNFHWCKLVDDVFKVSNYTQQSKITICLDPRRRRSNAPPWLPYATNLCLAPTQTLVLANPLLRPRSHFPRRPWGLQNLRPLAIIGRPQYFHGHTM